jgi:hypothetical protein
MRNWLALASAVFGAGWLATCGDSKSCVPSKCASGALMTIPLASTASGLTGASVTACRNTECYTAQLPAVPAAGDTEATLYFTGTAYVLGALWQDSSRAIGLDIEWLASSSPLPVQDGDHYVVTLTSAAGVATTVLDKVATYAPLPPNPEECSGSAVCQIAELTP